MADHFFLCFEWAKHLTLRGFLARIVSEWGGTSGWRWTCAFQTWRDFHSISLDHIHRYQCTRNQMDRNTFRCRDRWLAVARISRDRRCIGCSTRYTTSSVTMRLTLVVHEEIFQTVQWIITLLCWWTRWRLFRAIKIDIIHDRKGFMKFGDKRSGRHAFLLLAGALRNRSLQMRRMTASDIAGTRRRSVGTQVRIGREFRWRWTMVIISCDSIKLAEEHACHDRIASGWRRATYLSFNLQRR